MAHHPHAPHHHSHAVAVSVSLLRMSAIERLALAAAVIAVMWGAVFWAIA